MKKIFVQLESRIDDLKIKTKLYLLYIFCVLLPLFLTDSIIIYSVIHSEQISVRHDMENVANAVKYSFTSSTDGVADIAKSIYMNKYIDDFLNCEFETELDYIVGYQAFFKDTLFESGLGSKNLLLTLYSDNETIINGGNFKRLTEAKDTDWYRYLKELDRDKVLYFTYDESKESAVDAERKLLFVQKLNFYHSSEREKILKIEMDYSGMVRNLVKMNYDMPVYICQGDKILISNDGDTSVHKDFQKFKDWKKVGYTQELSLYGLQLDIYVFQPEEKMLAVLRKELPVLFLLIFVNIILPFILVHGLNHSFTERISQLSRVFKKVDDEKLVEISDIRGRDEISNLMRNYNKMVRRTNSLIQIVYKNRIREQEMTVARQNAELLALHSQINPHFLFNALESIRMHSILKSEYETADMVEKLAILQRQYVEWGDDSIDIASEMEFVRAYLGLQKYRFGDRLCYDLTVEKDCEKLKIPKLTVVTFVENACVHGIESKTTLGWIFVRIYRKEELLWIEIEDTGTGMDEATMRKMQENMEKASLVMLKDKRKVGVINACLRLKMVTEEEAHFKLDGEEGVGMMVQISIPLKYVK